jgi:hypothetical protein
VVTVTGGPVLVVVARVALVVTGIAVIELVVGVAFGFAARAAVTEVVVDSGTGGQSTTAVVSVEVGESSASPTGDWVATCTPGSDGPAPQPAATSARPNMTTTPAG